MAQLKPVIAPKASSKEGWDDELHGRVQWQTLFSAEHTQLKN